MIAIIPILGIIVCLGLLCGLHANAGATNEGFVIVLMPVSLEQSSISSSPT